MADRTAAIPTHEAYFAAQPAGVRERLAAIQSLVETRIPAATRCIGYRMPAFRDGRIFVYFAAFKRHIGVYPPVMGDDALMRALAPYRGPKGNLSFPLDAPLPLALIERVVLALHAQYAGGGPPAASPGAGRDVTGPGR